MYQWMWFLRVVPMCSLWSHYCTNSMPDSASRRIYSMLSRLIHRKIQEQMKMGYHDSFSFHTYSTYFPLQVGTIDNVSYIRIYVCMYVCMDGWLDGCIHFRPECIAVVVRGVLTVFLTSFVLLISPSTHIPIAVAWCYEMMSSLLNYIPATVDYQQPFHLSTQQQTPFY